MTRFQNLFNILMAISNNKLTQAQIALHLNKSVLELDGSINWLYANSFIECRETQDKRADKVFILTAKGYAYVEQIKSLDAEEHLKESED